MKRTHGYRTQQRHQYADTDNNLKSNKLMCNCISRCCVGVRHQHVIPRHTKSKEYRSYYELKKYFFVLHELKLLK